MEQPAKRISKDQLNTLEGQMRGLVGSPFKSLTLPRPALAVFEPSQIGTIVGALMDALIPYLPDLTKVGLSKHAGLLGEREGYPDYKHDESGCRLELKLLYVDNPDLPTKKPPTPREPSARITQKVTVKNVDPERDAMLLIAYRLEPHIDNPDAVSPTIIDVGVFSMIELVEARDQRLAREGRWFGNYETPCILSRQGRRKVGLGIQLDTSSYGRKESEGKDFNEDTNFGKLKRVPHPELQAFLKKYRVSAADQPADAEAIVVEPSE
jgi:hypothetical protein